MKVSLNSLQNIYRYFQTGDGATAIGAEALAAKIGSQLGEIDEIAYLGGKYQGVIIVKVVTCDPHPDADKLHVCKVDDGGKAEGVDRDENGYVQVVCGAPNVHAGMLAVWLPPNSTVPETVGKEPFVLGSRELRGVMSNGMLASPKELAFGDSHSGILEVQGDYPAGSDFAEATGLKGDAVFDIENKMFTHRPDCFGLLGVAREAAGIQGLSFKSPDWYTVKPELPAQEAEELPLVIKNDIPELVPRFTVLTIRDVKVAPSPLWLQVELIKSGVRPINNLVDIGNYIMMLTGQPLHIYDYDKVKAHDAGASAATLCVRQPKDGEELTLLNGKSIKPRSEAIVIATESSAIGLGGVMGGADTEVSIETANIIVECATFDMYSIRRTSMEHGIFSDAVTRFNKGQSPLQNLAVMGKLVSALQDISGGKIAGTLIDNNHLPQEVISRGSLNAPVTLTADYVNIRLGTDLTAEAMRSLLQNVEFEVNLDQDLMTVKAPFWRTDIELKEDVVEEIGRLYGYDHLPLVLPKRDLAPAAKEPLLSLKQEVRETLSAYGANEVLTYSFVHGNLLEKVGQDKSKAYGLSNALSPDLQYYRLNVLPSLMDKVHPNIKAGYDEFALFEMGKTHEVGKTDESGLPKEAEVLAFIYTAHDKLKKTGAAYYEAKAYLENLAKDLGVSLEFETVEGKVCTLCNMFAEGRVAHVSIKGQEESIGMIGEFSADARHKLKLPEHTAGFEIDLCRIMAAKSIASKYKALPKFPKVTQDITLRVPAATGFSGINEALESSLKDHQIDNSHHTLSTVAIYQSEDDKDFVNITWRYTVANYDRTLTDKEVNKVLDEATASLGPIGAIRV